MSAAA
jgi:hypothetical protein